MSLSFNVNIAVDWVMMSLESQNRTNAFDVKYSVSYASQLVTKLSFYNLKTMQCIRYHHHPTYLSFLLCGHFAKCPNGFAFQRLHWNILHISISKLIELSNTYLLLFSLTFTLKASTKEILFRRKMKQTDRECISTIKTTLRLCSRKQSFETKLPTRILFYVFYFIFTKVLNI